MNISFDAVLINWTYNTEYQGRIRGFCIRDDRSVTIHTGFKDEYVITSQVQKITKEAGYSVATTKSGTRYLLL